MQLELSMGANANVGGMLDWLSSPNEPWTLSSYLASIIVHLRR